MTLLSYLILFSDVVQSSRPGLGHELEFYGLGSVHHSTFFLLVLYNILRVLLETFTCAESVLHSSHRAECFLYLYTATAVCRSTCCSALAPDLHPL